MREEPPHHHGGDDRGTEDDAEGGTGQITFLAGELRHDDFKAALQIGDVRADLIGLSHGQRVFVWHAVVAEYG